MVMYRDFALRKANSLNIVGTVKNEKDGTVLLCAEGEEARLQQYIKQLKQGSLLSQVERMMVTWGDSRGKWDDFSIIY